MLKKVKMLLMSSLLAGSFLFPIAGASVVFAAASPTSNLCNGANLSLDTNGSGCSSASSSTGTLNNLIALIVNLFSVIVGIIAVIMIIVGGVKYVTSGGESSAVSSAKNTILYAIIGLIVVALAQVIVKFVLAKLAGNNIGN